MGSRKIELNILGCLRQVWEAPEALVMGRPGGAGRGDGIPWGGMVLEVAFGCAAAAVGLRGL